MRRRRIRETTLIFIVVMTCSTRARDRVLFGFASVEAQFAVRRAAEGAALRLGDVECQRVLSDFRLSTVSDAVRAFGELRFFDDSRAQVCRRGTTLAFTTPGASVIHICSVQFKATYGRQPMTSEVILIHEFLHSLGLGENPPSSAAITARVVARCGR